MARGGPPPTMIRHPPAVERTASERSRRLLARHGDLLALAVAALVVAWIARSHVLPAQSWNRDEPVYLWHVEILRAGRLTASDGGFPAAFQPWLAGHGADGYFSQYTPGWPLALLGGALLGGTGITLAVAAALAVVGTALLVREVTGDRVLGAVAGAVMLASPIVLVQAGAHLSYLFTLGLGLLAVTALLAGARLGRRSLALVAGVLLGAIFLTRPFDALLWGGVGAVQLVVTYRRALLDRARLAGWLVIGALPFLLVTLLYNHRITGSATTFPVTAKDQLDAFGFGIRRLMPEFDPVDYQPATAIRALAKHAFFLPWFLLGTYLGALAAAAGAWIRRRDRATLLFLLVAAVFPLAHLPFFGTFISSLATRVSGPIYFIPAYASLSYFVAVAVLTAWRRRASLGLLMVAVLLLATIPLGTSRVGLNRAISDAQRPWQASIPPGDDDALVVVEQSGPYLMHLNPRSVNAPDLGGRVRWATDQGALTLELIAATPDRTPYLQRSSLIPEELGPREDPRTPRVTLIPLVVESGAAVEVDVRVQGPAGLGSASITFGSEAWTTPIPLDGDGTGRLAWEIVPDGAGPVASGAGDGAAARLTMPDGLATLAVAFGSVPSTLEDGDPVPAFGLEVHLRAVDGRVEVLLPTPVGRFVERPNGTVHLHPGVEVPELDVRARAR